MADHFNLTALNADASDEVIQELGVKVLAPSREHVRSGRSPRARTGVARAGQAFGAVPGDAQRQRRSLHRDLPDVKGIETQALASALDSFAVGVVIVGDRGAILHSNAAARRMLAAGTPIQSNGGRIATGQAKTTAELRQAIAVARANEAEIGRLGIGVPLVDHSNWTGTAHVLPLARGVQRGRLMPQATAAVFVMAVHAPEPVDLHLVARIFSLTPAEARLLNLLAAGDDLGEAAEKLRIGEATAKTHRTHLYAKMGIKSRAELLAMLAGLVPPIHHPPEGNARGLGPAL